MSGGDFLQVLINDPQLAWLAPFTTLIVRLEELEDHENEGAESDAAATLALIRELLSLQPERSVFHRRYAQRVDEDPDVAVAHGVAVTELRAVDPRFTGAPASPAKRRGA
jgi:hypothetical protein